MEGRDLEKSMSLVNMLGLDNSLEMDLSNGLTQTDDGLKMSDCDGDTRVFL